MKLMQQSGTIPCIDLHNTQHNKSKIEHCDMFCSQHTCGESFLSHHGHGPTFTP